MRPAFSAPIGNYDEGTGFDADECDCVYTNPIAMALGDQSFAWAKAHTNDANLIGIRSLARKIRFEARGYRAAELVG